MSNRIELQIGANVYPYWDNVQVSKRIDAISSSFELSISGLNPSELSLLPINVGDMAGLRINGQYVVSGYVDTKNVSFSKTDHTISISGRDNTGDLVDCSAIASGEFKNQSIYQIANALCSPLNIPVLPYPSTPISSFKIDPGESVFEALERLSRVEGVLLRPDGLGNLRIADIGTIYARSALIQGANILYGSADYDHTDRFKNYLVLGQNMTPLDGEQETEKISDKSSDLGIKRNRSKIIIANSSINQNQAKALAEWEATVRAARSLSVTIETQDWLQADGSLWDVNELVRLSSDVLGIDAYMLTTGVDLSFSQDEGTIASIELTRRDAFKPSPVVEDSNVS